MTREPRPDKKSSGKPGREERLKAALKANMGRRKAQARARADEDSDDKPGDATAADNEME